MISSLYTAATGLKSIGDGMNVVSNNLANVSTVGFKKTMMLYQDLVSSNISTGANGVTETSQKGRGVRDGELLRLFNQGSFEQSNSATDIGIEGKGFFGVQKDGVTQYTRAGNFVFKANGDLSLADTSWNLMGYSIKNGVKSTTATPIQLDLTDGSAHATLAPQASTKITSIVQLGGLTTKSTDTENPFFAMTAQWDATKKPALASGAYSYSQPVSFLNSDGETVNATMYFNLSGEKNGSKVVEYTLGMNPGEESTEKSAGLLMAGTLTFDSAGQMTNMTAFNPSGDDPADLGSWTAAELQDGAPVFTIAGEEGESQSIALNMGLTLTTSTSGLSSPEDFASNQEALYAQSPGSTKQSRSSYLAGASSASVYQTADGWTKGSLNEVEVTADGYVRGHYTNGQTQDLFQIPLYRFSSEEGLRAEGGNRFSETQDSGAATIGDPTTENFGTLAGGYLETSNVDYSEEMVNLITTQRSFQMNSKMITTADSMLQKAMELKR